jgi:MoxR-like ATPase
MNESKDTLRYVRIFNPEQERPESDDPLPRAGLGDHREEAEYVYTPQIILAVNVALATGRPLLVRGPAGSGKSSLAPDIARRKRWQFYPEVITSHTRAQDLLWSFDALERLRDAQAGAAVDEIGRYIKPGVLWRALDPMGALRHTSHDRSMEVPSDGAVVLLDEIDKADPDVPNDLLIPIGSGVFEVRDLKRLPVSLQRPQSPLILITTNEERALPRAFLRRCVVLTLPEPKRQRLIRIAEVHFGPDDGKLYGRVANLLMRARARAMREGAPPPSTAEYLDALEACRRLRVLPGSREWRHVALGTLEKWVGGSVAHEG